MSYIGSSATPLPVAFSGVRTQSFSGTGSQTAFTLSRAVSAVTDIEVVVNNVQQSPFDSSYNISGATLTFSEAPSSGTNNIYVIFRDQPVGSLAPADGSITPAKLDRAYVNKAGDNLTNSTFQLSSFVSLQATDVNGYPRINGAGSSAQLGLFRSSGGAEGGMFIGANADEFAVWDSSFNRRLIVDQSGRVKMPNQPGFGGYVSAQRTSNGTYINFSTLLGNWNQGGHFNASTGVFTAPVGGRYLITVTGKSDNSSTTTRGLVRLFVNGSQYDEVVETYGQYQDVGSAQLLQLAANDTLYTTIEGASAGTPFRVAFGAILLG